MKEFFRPIMRHPTRPLLMTAAGVLLVVLGLSGGAAAGPIEDAEEAVQRKDFLTAKALLEPAAGAGNTRAMYQLGQLYHYGLGVEQDRDRSLKLFLSAANRGNLDARFMMGFLYHNGQGVPESLARAYDWYRPAAEAGQPDAQHWLGVFFENGWHVQKDFREAVFWFRQAAEQQHQISQVRLGMMYENGQGVPQDFAEAHKWYNLASGLGKSSDADMSQMLATRSRERMELRMTRDQIAEAQRLAREWKPKR